MNATTGFPALRFPFRPPSRPWRWLVPAAALLAAAAPGSAADAGQETRFGLGMSAGRADLRYELNAMSAVGSFLGLDLVSGSVDTHDVEVGMYYLRRMVLPNPAGYHLTGGLTYQAEGAGPVDRTAVSLFGGIGLEYFLPGTRQVSLEAGLGLALRFVNEEAGAGPFATKAKGTGVAVTDLTGGFAMLRYYFD